MNPLEEGKILVWAEIHILVKKSYSPHIVPKTKGLEESLIYQYHNFIKHVMYMLLSVRNSLKDVINFCFIAQ